VQPLQGLLLEAFDLHRGDVGAACGFLGQAIEGLPPEAYFLEALLVLVACPACRHVRSDDAGNRAPAHNQ